MQSSQDEERGYREEEVAEEKAELLYKATPKLYKDYGTFRTLGSPGWAGLSFVLGKKITSPCANCGLAQSIGSSKTEWFERLIC